MNQRLIGLTGGIATGKTTVSNYLAQKYHLPILDADTYAKEAVAPDSPILQKIFHRYGKQVISNLEFSTVDQSELNTSWRNLSLNRAALGEIIFNHPQEKQWLENQIHPYVRDRFQQELQCLNNDTVVLDIPLLFEANLEHMVTEIWVVSCDRSLQLQRLQQRNNLTLVQAQARIDSQLPLAQKVVAADIVLHNNQTLEDLFRQVDRAINLNA